METIKVKKKQTIFIGLFNNKNTISPGEKMADLTFSKKQWDFGVD